ncbi:MAG: hypothetical protein GY949_21110, partial [Gammaproteobacteria bacterium]|nr:hypothetical protein [Gammaproteobacteria bacterium]
FPEGPWTPDLLAESISEFAANPGGVDLRAVQIWFQENDRGIGINNIRWLARIFGCNDPDATSQWQAALSAANRRLVEKRKEKRKVENQTARSSLIVGQGFETTTPTVISPIGDAEEPIWQFSLASRTEALFGNQSCG